MNTIARIDEVVPYEGDEDNILVTARTPEGNIVFFNALAEENPALGATVSISGKVARNETRNHGRFSKVKASGVDVETVSSVAAPDPERRPDLSAPANPSPVGPIGERIERKWAVTTEIDESVNGVYLVRMRTQDNQEIVIPTDRDFELNSGDVVELSGSIRNVTPRGHTYIDRRSVSLNRSGETYNGGGA